MERPAPDLAEVLRILTEPEHRELQTIAGEHFPYFQHQLFQRLFAPKTKEKKEITDTWTEHLRQESYRSPLQSEIAAFLGLSPTEAPALSPFSEFQNGLRGRHWIDAQSVAIMWGPIFHHFEWLKAHGCGTDKPVESWLTNESCLGQVRSLYGALSEAWLLSPQHNVIPGTSIRVGGKQHADGWKASFDGPSLKTCFLG